MIQKKENSSITHKGMTLEFSFKREETDSFTWNG